MFERKNHVTAMREKLLRGNICYAIKGVFASDSGIVGDPKGDFAAALLQEVPTGNAPFFALSSGMPSAPAMDTVIHWFEESHLSGRTTLNEVGFDSSETDMTVADASFIVAGAILLVETTGEQVLVTSVSSSVLTIVRGYGGTTASAATSGDGVQKIGTAHSEGSEKPVAVMNIGDPIFNFTQIFRNTWNVTGTTAAVQYYTGSKVAKSKRDASLFHAEDIERSLWFGVRANGSVGGMPFRTMNGVDSMITTNVTAAGATTNWDELEEFIRGIFEKNIKGKPNERIAFCGNTALSVINGIARLEGTVMLDPGATEFGLNVTKWITPFGNISLMTHPMFVESPLWTKDLRILHPGAVELRWLRRTSLDDYDQDGRRAGVDADYGVYTSELSMSYGVETTGGRLTGMTAAAAVP